MKRTMTAVVLTTAGMLAVTGPADAWNLICGITIASATAPGVSAEAWDSNIRTMVWDADSHAIRGISLSYLGISELQRVDLGAGGSFTSPQSFTGSSTVIEAAVTAFRNSSSEFDTALASAKANHLGDAIGLTLLQQMHDQSAAILANLSTEKSLPTLTNIQSLVSTMTRYTAHGIELSQMHLKMGMAGHGEGGNKFKTP